LVPELDRLASIYKVETIYYVYFEYSSKTAQEWLEDGTFDYKGTPLVVLFENGDVSYSNFTYQNPNSIYYNDSANYTYYHEILRMFEGF